MGHKQSTPGDADNKHAEVTHEPPTRSVDPCPIQPAVIDIETDGAALCDTSPKLFEEVQRAAETIQRSQYWKLLYTTRAGRSFPRMVRHICNGGPSVIVLELLSASQHRLILTTVNRTTWKTAAERKGAKDMSEPSSKKVSTGYFGDSNCLVHALDPNSGAFTTLVPKYSSSSSAPAVASANNFMYLIDDPSFATPPSEVGIGMGGLPGRWSWFVGDDLEKCLVAPSSTFRSTSDALDGLLAISEWTVVQLDVFALEPDAHRPLEARRDLERRHLVKCFAMDAAGVSSNGSKQSVLDSQGAAVTMALLQLGGAHTSYSEREDICERNYK
jgi:hypothetical protein